MADFGSLRHGGRMIDFGSLLQCSGEHLTPECAKTVNNIYEFNEELFEKWLDENGGDCLQDGCSYSFGGACYDLNDFGSNACSIDPESIEKAFNKNQ